MIVIPRNVASWTALSRTMACAESMKIPSWPPAERAPLDETRRKVGGERDVNPLAVRASERADGTIAHNDLPAAHVDSVHQDSPDIDILENDVRDAGQPALDSDPVLATLDVDAPDRHVARRDDDAAANHRAGRADNHLGVVEHERPFVHAGREMDCRWLGSPRRSTSRREDDEHEDDDRRSEPAELPSILRVLEPHQREARMGENLREEPGAAEERQCDGERRLDPQHPHEPHEGGELDQPEGKRRPPRLIAEIPMVGPGVEGQPDHHHEKPERERPPVAHGEREPGGRE